MTRRQGRYERRQKERKLKREKALQNYGNIDNVINYAALYKAALQSAKGVKWKASVQKYLLNLLVNINHAKTDIEKGKDIRQGFIEFDLVERGKVRHIRSVHFPERVIQKTICTNALYPILTYNLITDNGASQKGKGTHFATKRLEQNLRKYYRHYGNHGYVLVLDFKKFFDNISHKIVKDIYRENFNDLQVKDLLDKFVDAFGDVGLGLGSETSQISAVAYINKIDHFIKDKLGIKAYGRYMDDSYIIHHSKEYLQELLKILQKKYESYNITLNTKKSHIIPLHKGFTFLKTRFYLSDTGKVIKKPCRDSITRERKRLKKQFGLYQKGLIDIDTINRSYQSWRGSMKHRNARRSIYVMDKLYCQLFNKKEVNYDRR